MLYRKDDLSGRALLFSTMRKIILQPHCHAACQVAKKIIPYDRRTDRAGVYDLHGTLLAEAGTGAIGIQPDEAFVPDSYYCGAYLHYTASDNGSVQVSFDVRLCADGSAGDGTLKEIPC